MQSVSVITLPVTDLARSTRFYEGGFGWSPVFVMEDIRFYQLNGLVFGLWLGDALAEDAGVESLVPAGSIALAHNVHHRSEVEPLMARLAENGGEITRPAAEPPHGGYRGYLRDPDGHLWEIAHNPVWRMDESGATRFAIP